MSELKELETLKTVAMPDAVNGIGTQNSVDTPDKGDTPDELDKALPALSHLLSGVILPALKRVQERQGEQIAQSDRIEAAIQELRQHIELQFSHLNAQLAHNCDELLRLRATLIALQIERSSMNNVHDLVH